MQKTPVMTPTRRYLLCASQFPVQFQGKYMVQLVHLSVVGFVSVGPSVSLQIDVIRCGQAAPSYETCGKTFDRIELIKRKLKEN